MKNEIEYFRRKLLSEIEEEKQMCPECYGPMNEGVCMECGYMEEELSGGQKKLDVAEPKGQLTAADFAKLRSMKKENGDHEVSMAHSSLEAIVQAAQELMMKMGEEERNIPGWIQDHITNAENYISQAAKGFHEIEPQQTPPEVELGSIVAEILAESKSKKKKPVEKPTKKKKTK